VYAVYVVDETVLRNILQTAGGIATLLAGSFCYHILSYQYWSLNFR